MGVPVLKTVFIFIQICQILITSCVSGLPFASISSIASLKSSAESLSNEDSSPPSAAIVNLIPSSSEITSSTSSLVQTSPGNFQLIISSPYILNVDLSSDNFSPSSNSALNSEEVFYESQGIPKTKLVLSHITHADNLTSAESLISSLGGAPLHSSSNVVASSRLPTFNVESNFVIPPNVDLDFNLANYKREARNTKLVTLRPLTDRVSSNSEASSNNCIRESTDGPVLGLSQSNYAMNPFNNSPFQSSKMFSLSPSRLLCNPIRSPCLKMPINLTKSPPLSCSDNNLESNKSTTDCLETNGLSSSISNIRPVLNENCLNSFQTGLSSSQKASSQVINIDNELPLFSNNTNPLCTFNNPFIQSNMISNSAMQSSNQFKNRYFILQDSFATNLVNDNSIKSFQNIGPSSKFSVTGSQNTGILDPKPITAQFPQNIFNLQKIPQTDTTVSPNQVSQVNNNFINSQDAVNTINDIVPLPFKTSPQTSSLNQNNIQECPQSETVKLNNNIITVPNDNVIYPSSNFNLHGQNNNYENNPGMRLNRDDQLEKLKNSINVYNNLKTEPLLSLNSNQGCPQLYSIPFNKATLPNKQINIKNNNNDVVDSTQGQNSNILIQNSNIRQMPHTVNSQNLNIALNKLNYIKALSQNPNNQGCPQLLSIQPPTNIFTSQNNLAKVKDSIKNEDNESSNIQISNDNLGPQAIPTTYIDNSIPQKIGNIATFTLKSNKINTLNAQPVSNLENTQVKTTKNINNNNYIFQIPKSQIDNSIRSQNNDFTCQSLNNNIITIPNSAIKLSDSSNLNTVPSSLTLKTPSNLLSSQNAPNNIVQSIKFVPSVQNIGSGQGSNNVLTLQDFSSKPQGITNFNPFSYIPLEGNTGTLNNIPLSSINSASPCTCNVAPSVPTVSLLNLTPSVPKIPQTSFCNTESSATIPLAINHSSYSNNNLQNLLTLLKCNNNNPVAPNNGLSINNSPVSPFKPIQSLPQVSFVNSVPSPINISPITISLSDNQNVLSSLSNLPIVCTSSLTPYTSYQPIITPYTTSPILSALLSQVSLGSSSLYSSLNSIASALTQNIMSTVISKTSPSSSPSNLPPVNTYTLISECNPDDSVCLDISESLAPYLMSTSSSSPRLSLPKIPIACNEYLPPLSNSQIIPINSEIFFSCVEPDSYDTFTPSYMMPSVSDATVYILPSF